MKAPPRSRPTAANTFWGGSALSSASTTGRETHTPRAMPSSIPAHDMARATKPIRYPPTAAAAASTTIR
jgi:hypothetical protein